MGLWIRGIFRSIGIMRRVMRYILRVSMKIRRWRWKELRDLRKLLRYFFMRYLIVLISVWNRLGGMVLEENLCLGKWIQIISYKLVVLNK
jgi:hypothetical protein